MANSFEVYTGDGVTTQFVVTFPFISRTHVTLKVNGVSVAFTWINDGLIQAAVAPANGTVVRVGRSSSPTTTLVDFEAGYISADDLDTGYLHAFYLAQEAVDAANESMTKNALDQWEAQGDKIQNLANGVDVQDAVTLAQLQAVSAAAGNVPTPGNPTNDNWFLKALSGTFAWFNLFGTANTWTEEQTISRTGTNSLTQVSSNSGTGDGPINNMKRNKVGVIGDILGSLRWFSLSSTSVERQSGAIDMEVVDPTNASEDYLMRFRSMIAGTLGTRFKLGNGLWSVNALSGDMGADSINAKSFYLDGQSFLPRGYIDGFNMSNNGTDSTNDIDVSAGAAAADTDDAWIRLAASITKRIDASWAVGSGNGGMDTGSVANSTWYHVWAIMRPDTGVVDVLFSTSATSPTMPTNYTKKRRIGSVFRTSGAANRQFIQRGDWFIWKTRTLDINTTTLSTTATNFVLPVPTGVRVEAQINYSFAHASAIRQAYFYSPDITDETCDVTQGRSNMARTTGYNPVGELNIWTDTSAQIRGVGTAAACEVTAGTVGWRDLRGKGA